MTCKGQTLTGRACKGPVKHDTLYCWRHTVADQIPTPKEHSPPKSFTKKDFQDTASPFAGMSFTETFTSNDMDDPGMTLQSLGRLGDAFGSNPKHILPLVMWHSLIYSKILDSDCKDMRTEVLSLIRKYKTTPSPNGKPCFLYFFEAGHSPLYYEHNFKTNNFYPDKIVFDIYNQELRILLDGKHFVSFLVWKSMMLLFNATQASLPEIVKRIQQLFVDTQEKFKSLISQLLRVRSTARKLIKMALDLGKHYDVPEVTPKVQNQDTLTSQVAMFANEEYDDLMIRINHFQMDDGTWQFDVGSDGFARIKASK